MTQGKWGPGLGGPPQSVQDLRKPVGRLGAKVPRLPRARLQGQLQTRAAGLPKLLRTSCD